MATKKITETIEEEPKVAKKKTAKVATKKAVVVEVSGAGEKAIAKSNATKTTLENENSPLNVAVYDTTGKEVDTIDLPAELFGAKVNPVLMAQAVRVYLANQRQGTASTKTRGEVRGSTRKIYRQKGTGRARHGGVRAPIFVKGGIAHGPKPQDHSLAMPKKMKRAALFSALTAKLAGNQVRIVSGIEALAPKTKLVMGALNNFGLSDKKAKVLVVTAIDTEAIIRSGRNLKGVTITAADRINTYEVLNTKSLVLMKEAVERLQEVFGKK